MSERAGFEAQLARVHESCGTSSLNELAVFMRASMPELTDARRRGKIPADWLLFLLRTGGINPEWILSGCGPRQLDNAVLDETPVYADAPTARELAEELLRRIALTNS